MNYILSTLLSYLLLYKYAAIFLLVLSSAIIVPVPENTLLLATGAFASQGYFNLTLSLICAISANVIGDCIGYMLTYKWGYRVIKEHHIRKYSYIKKIDEYMREHAGLTIFLTRFTGTIGPIVNFLAGLARISFKRFLAFDILGNTLDIGFFIFAGYLLGSVWQNFSGILDIVGWIVLVLVLLIIFGKIFWKRSKKPETESKSVY